MFNIREMKAEDKAVIMPMVITFYHSPAVEHDVDTAVLERTFDAATDPTMPYISGLVMLEVVILLILIAAYRLTAPRTDAGCGACKGSCSSCEKGSIYARYRQDHPLDK